MICKNCGTDFSTNFCPKCGMKAEEIEKSMIMKSPKKKKKSNGPVIAIIAVICALAIAVGGFCVYKLFFDKGSEDKKEPSSASETKKDDKKAKSRKYDFSESELSDDNLKALAEAGVLKKHIDYMPHDEIMKLIKMGLNADFEAATAEEFVDAFEGYLRRASECSGEEYDREGIITELQEQYETFGTTYYIAENKDYILVQEAYNGVEVDDEGEYIDFMMIYDTKTEDAYVIDNYNSDYGDYRFVKWVFDDDFVGGLTLEYDNENDATTAYYISTDESTVVLYDESGDLLGVHVYEDYYDSKLNPISEEEFDKIRDTIME